MSLVPPAKLIRSGALVRIRAPVSLDVGNVAERILHLQDAVAPDELFNPLLDAGLGLEAHGPKLGEVNPVVASIGILACLGYLQEEVQFLPPALGPLPLREVQAFPAEVVDLTHRPVVVVGGR